LTTIDVSKRKIGQFAISVLDDQIRSSERQPAIKILVGANLVVRSSVIPVQPQSTELRHLYRAPP